MEQEGTQRQEDGSLSTDAAAMGGAAMWVPAPAQPPHVRVLVVEDDEDDYVLTRSLLEEIRAHAFAIDWVRDYEAARQRLCAGGYDVCLADYRLGARNGVELVREVVRNGCAIPVIVLTGQGDIEIDLAAMAAGAADFLNKSEVTSGQLERAIRYSIQQRRLEEQRVRLLQEQSARREAEAASRAKDQFLAALSHELRTPLTPVLMAVSGLCESPDLPARFRADVETIKRNVELEALLIDDLLDLTRVTRGKLVLHWEVVDVAEKLASVMQIVRGEVEAKGLRVVLDVACSPCPVRADGARLQQILWNLIKNAVKFTPEGGEVRVGVRGEMRRRKAAGGNEESETIVVEVRDTGIGIDPSVLPHIFTPFQQGGEGVTQTFGGLGLGLSISKALVDMHEGELSADSAGRGKGATFTLRLPRAAGTIERREASRPDRARTEAAGVAAGASAGVAPSRHILLVEDHADTSKVMAKLLKGYGYRVSVAGSKAAALKVAGEERFDLVISDIGLPDGSGLELMRELKRRLPVRGIALSGFGMEEDVKRSREAGFEEHLTKPIDLETLREKLATMLGN